MSWCTSRQDLPLWARVGMTLPHFVYHIYLGKVCLVTDSLLAPAHYGVPSISGVAGIERMKGSSRQSGQCLHMVGPHSGGVNRCAFLDEKKSLLLYTRSQRVSRHSVL